MNRTILKGRGGTWFGTSTENRRMTPRPVGPATRLKLSTTPIPINTPPTSAWWTPTAIRRTGTSSSSFGCGLLRTRKGHMDTACSLIPTCCSAAQEQMPTPMPPRGTRALSLRSFTVRGTKEAWPYTTSTAQPRAQPLSNTIQANATNGLMPSTPIAEEIPSSLTSTWT